MSDAVHIPPMNLSLNYNAQTDDVVLEALPDIVTRVAADGTFLWLNSAFENVLGWPVKEWVGKSFGGLVHPDDLGRAQKQFEDNLKGNRTISELRVRSARGYLRIESTTIPQIMNGKVVSVVAVSRDITARREEEELANQRLEETVRERTRALALANEALKKEIAHRQQVEEKLRRRENELKSRENYLAQITHSLPALISYLDVQQRFQFVNAEYEKWFGQPQSWFRGKTLQEVVGDSAYERLRPHLAKAFAGEVVAFDSWITYLHGQRHITANYVPDFSVTQEVKGIFVLVQDTTERKHFEEALQQSEARLRYVMENMPVMLDAFDFHGNIILWNAECERVTGYRASEIVNNPKAMEILYPNDDYRKEMMARWSEVGHDFRDWEWDIRCKDGSIKTVAWSNVSKRFPIPGWHSWGIGIDVTDRKRSAEEIRRHSEELARSNADLSQFAWVASHDLKEPLRMVKTHVQLISVLMRDKLNEEAKESIRFAEEGATRMSQLISDLLSYASVGNADTVFGEVALDSTLKNALDNLKASLLETEAVVRHESLPPVMGNEPQLLQIFQNLIGNAIRFCEKRRPEIQVSAIEHKDKIEVIVKDNGIGIEPRYAKKIFVIFQRLNRRTEYPGTGIGLSICKKIVERHGGRIWVESEVGQGSEFHFTLPKATNLSAQ